MIDNNTGHLTVEIKAGTGGPLQVKNINVAESRQTVTADNGYYGLSQVTVSAATLQSKSVVPKVETQVITADNGFYGLRKVTVCAVEPVELKEINVKATATEQIVVPSKPYIGFSKVTVGAIKANELNIVPSKNPQTIAPADKGVEYFNEVNVEAVKIDSAKNVTPSKTKQIVTPSAWALGISSVTVEAIPASYNDTSDATATAENVAKGYTAYVNGGKITGTGVLAEMDAVKILDGSITLIKSSVNSLYFKKSICNALTAVKVIDMPNLRFNNNNFYFTSSLALEKIRCVGVEGFDTSVWSLRELYLTEPDAITTNLKINLYYLETLILAGEYAPTLSDASYISDSVVIYVTDSLVDKYKSATNWSAHADQIKPISEYGGWSDNA